MGLLGLELIRQDMMGKGLSNISELILSFVLQSFLPHALIQSLGTSTRSQIVHNILCCSVKGLIICTYTLNISRYVLLVAKLDCHCLHVGFEGTWLIVFGVKLQVCI